MRAYRVLIPALALMASCSPSSGHSAAQPAPALAEPARVVPTSPLTMKQSFAPVAKRVSPAVVNISSKRVVRTDPFFQLFGFGAPRDRIEGSLGSGVIVRADGVIVTNNHVIAGGQEITVSLYDRREFTAKVLLADPRTDLAVLKIEVPGERLPTLAIDDHGDNQVGDLVLAVGDPFGVGQTVTNGIISALNRTDPSGAPDSGAYIQTDAAINPGNSGGALVNMEGDLIGVNSFILSQSGGSSGVGFAIPAPVVRRIVETAVGGAHAFVRPWLGARLQNVTPDIAKAAGLPAPSGALVADIWPGGVAAQAGLKQGDVIASVDGAPAVDAASVNFAIGNHRAGDTARLGVRRGSGQQTVTIKAEPPPASPPRDERTIAGRNPFQGATVVNLSPAVAEEVGVDPFGPKGVMLLKLAGTSQQVGFHPGDIVREVNGRAIHTTADLAAALAAPTRVWQLVLDRGGQPISVTFQG